ncbi:Spy/CpxP family protein refolding chaperone [Paraglaciecola aestuariivivens]
MFNKTSINAPRITPIALCLVLAFSAPSFAHKGKEQNHQSMRRMFSELDLSDAQKQDIRQLRKQNKADKGLMKQDAKLLNESLRSLVQADQWQATEVANVIAEQQKLFAQKALQQATNKHQVWLLLTTEQQAQLAQQMTDKKTNKKAKKAKKRKQHKRMKALDLTDQQVSELAAIREASQAEMQPVQAKIKEFKQSERQLIHSAEFSQAAWQSLWQQYQDDFTTAKMLKTKVKHDSWNLLTPEQQAKAEAKMRKHSKK